MADERAKRGKQHWEERTLHEALKKNPERPEILPAEEGGPQRLYTPADIDIDAYNFRIGYPGEIPFTRGVHPTMHRGRLWTMRQYAGFSTAEETNRRFKYLLEQGQTGLSVAFDLPTQIGHDSDSELAAGEVGRVGVAIDTLDDLDRLFDGIPLDAVSASMTINATAIILLAMYVALARRREVPLSQLSGTVQNDILKEYEARGTYAFPVTHGVRLVRDTFEFCTQKLPRFNPISISGYHIREAGSTAAQELAFTFANAMAYMDAAREGEIDLERLTRRTSFFFAVQNNVIEEVAKFRAARRIWCKLVGQRYGIENPTCQKLRFHAQTSGVTLTAQEPLNNIARVALQALTAAMGGCQSLHTNSWDEALALPSAEAARIALRTQQIVAYESGVADIIDPLGGSYAVEAQTDRLEEEVNDYLGRIQEMGGVQAALENGFIHNEIHESAFRFQRRVEEGKQVVVGVNRFTSAEKEAPPPTSVIDPAAEKLQIKKLREFKAGRKWHDVARALGEVTEAARTGENLMGPIISALESKVTLGEITAALREVFGVYQGPTGM